MSLWLIFFFFLVLGYIIIITTIQGPEDTTEYSFIDFIPLILQVIFGVGSLITGIISIIKKKERSILTYISTLIGLFVLWFIIGEIVVPH